MLLLFEEAFVIIVKNIEGSLWEGDCMMLWKVEKSFEEKTSISEVECVVCGVPLCNVGYLCASGVSDSAYTF